MSDGGDTGLWSSKFDIPDNLEFLLPGRLWWLLAIAGLFIAYVVMQFIRRGAAVRFTNVSLLDKIAPQRPNWRRHIPAFFLLLGLAGMIMAYAEPAAVSQVPSERATIMLAIDTSLSMQAEDVVPSRIDGAKEAATTFLEEVPEEINIGLVSFNGIATVRVPPTTNRAAVRSAIQGLDLGEATAIGEAIFASIDSLETFITEFEGDVPPARIVLMSDGETTVGRPDAAAVDRARLAGITVSTIAFGTDGGVIEIPEDPRPIPVPVNEDALAEIADGTGGEFHEAATTDELTEIYTDIGSAVATEEARVSVGSWFAGRAMILILIAAALSLVFSNRLP
ncbi:MAG: VWA domain-containing protein [Acidimicrobiaceae bacterium]|nr:VWA domain-containing protein [Acidimicrobiaceae bacterium]